MYGLGILRGLGVTLKHLIDTYTEDIQWLGKKGDLSKFQAKQSLSNRGLVTVEYPDEKLAVPERFRFIPFLVTYNNDDPQYPGKDWCTSCGICAKVCPPQCIWIVRGNDPTTGRPKPEPEAFYIDIDICMNCGYCAEYCPFDAIKMDHDYELASYDRTTNHIFDKDKLSKEFRYWETIAPTTAAEELAARGGYDHSDVQKKRKKEGLTPSRTGPIDDAPVAEPAVAAAPEAAIASAAPVVAPGQPAAASPVQTATPGAATTADGKPIYRRRGAGVAPKETGAAPSPTTPAASAPAASTAPAAPVAPARPATPVPTPTPPQAAASSATQPAAPSEPTGNAPAGGVQRGPRRVIDPNNPPPVVRRRNPPSK